MSKKRRTPRSHFLRIKCPNCGAEEQIIFERPTSIVKCEACETTLISPAGGKGEIKEKVEVLEVLS